MKGPESRFWANIRPKLKSFGDFTRHEDALQSDIPDVSYGADGANGWIELKALDEWPVRPHTPVHIDHFTTGQQMWLRRRGKTGGRCWLLIRIAGDTLLFHYTIISQIGDMTKVEMFRHCTRAWPRNKFNASELVWELTK